MVVRPRVDWPAATNATAWRQLDEAAREACKWQTAEAVIADFDTAEKATEWVANFVYEISSEMFGEVEAGDRPKTNQNRANVAAA
jgi:hypothetical protein